MNSNSWTGDLRSQNQLCKALVFGVEALFNGFGTLTRFNRTGTGYSTQNAFTRNGHLGGRGLTIHGKAPEKGLFKRLYHINEGCQQAGNPAPAFNESGDFVDIEFHRTEQLRGSSSGEEGGVIGGEEVVQSELTERQQAVLQLIIENPSRSQRELAEALKINTSAVQKHLDKLKEAGAIERMGGTRGYWKVKV